MSIFVSKESELNKSLNEASSNVMSEFDLQYSINELASFLHKTPSLDKKLVYTAEAVPVFITDKGDSKMFVIEQENLVKLMEHQHIDAATALRHIKESLEENLDDSIEMCAMDMSQFSVLFRQEDIDQLAAVCEEDPSRIQTRTEAVAAHTGFLNQIIAEGAKVIFK